jgi:hypothetical protein
MIALTGPALATSIAQTPVAQLQPMIVGVTGKQVVPPIEESPAGLAWKALGEMPLLDSRLFTS